MTGIVVLRRGRVEVVDGNTWVGGTVAAPAGLQSTYRVRFVALVDAVVDPAS